jgi:hypothetical protein
LVRLCEIYDEVLSLLGKKMKKNLLLILVFIVVIVLGVLLYVAFTPEVQSDVPLPEIQPVEIQPFSGASSGTEKSFEESFYQDLSDFFGENTNGYEEIQGEYGFVSES